MDAHLQSRADQLAMEVAEQASTAEKHNELLRLMMKSGLKRMLDAELEVHLGRRPGVIGEQMAGGEVDDSPPVGGKRPRSGSGCFGCEQPAPPCAGCD